MATDVQVRKHPAILEWFPKHCEAELNIKSDMYYIEVHQSKKGIVVAIHEKETNRFIKHIYMKEDITQGFVLGWDGLYYSPSWTQNGTDIEVDGLGWDLGNVRDYILEYEVLSDLAEHNTFERVLDDVRYCLN